MRSVAIDWKQCFICCELLDRQPRDEANTLKWTSGPMSRLLTLQWANGDPLWMMTFRNNPEEIYSVILNIRLKKTQDKSSDVEPLTTANKAIHCLKWRGGGGGGGGTKPTGKSYYFEAVHPTAISENYSSSRMLKILIKVQTVSILSNIFTGLFTHIISKRTKYYNNVFPKLITFQNIVPQFHKGISKSINPNLP